jgi:hypothetical protein
METTIIKSNKLKEMKKTNLSFAGLLFLFSFILASCSSTAHIEKDDTVNFNDYKTYAWIDKDKEKVKNIAEEKIKDVVNAELSKTAGWQQVDDNPDVLLSYDVLIEKSIQQKNDPVYSRPFTRTFYNPYTRRFFNVYYPSRFVGYDNYDIPVQEGTVSISMIDGRSNKTVWQGWTTNEIDSRQIKSKEVQAAVRSIFRKFDLAKN